MLDLIALSHRLRFTEARVLCIGDVMLDTFVYGESDRLSPEAPIPVVRVQREQNMPGGAGNVARNVASMGAKGTLIGVVGEDEAARTLDVAIDVQPGVRRHLVRCQGRTTTVKTRFVVMSQQLLRADREVTTPIDAPTVDKVLTAYDAELPQADIVVISDYAKGTLSVEVLRYVIDRARERDTPVIVDPKSKDFSRYRGATLIMPNATELADATGLPCHGTDDAARAAEKLRGCGIDNILVTRAAQGMTLVSLDGPPIHLEARTRETHEVSGAGDTVAATMAVALASGFDLEEAATLANIAAGIVVGKIGTATVYLQDLSEELHKADMMTLGAEIVTAEQVAERVAQWHAAGLKVGFTNGCFDLIHPGHISLLQQARAACDRLIVGLNTDDSTRRLKGPKRPIQSETARSVVLASLAMVDLVVPFDEDTPIRLIEAIRPDVLVKGADYAEHEVVGADLVMGYGGVVILAKLKEEFSTTITIQEVVESDALRSGHSPAPPTHEAPN